MPDDPPDTEETLWKEKQILPSLSSYNLCFSNPRTQDQTAKLNTVELSAVCA